MTVTVVYDNSEATELCAAQHLYLKPIAKLMINVLLPECGEPVRPFSNWEVLDQLKSLICPDQFTTVRLSKSTKDFIRFEGEAETRSLIQILKAKLHGKIIKLNGLKTDLKVVATDAQGEWEHFSKETEASVSDGAEEQDHDKSPDSIYFEGLPCKWFAPKGSSGEKPCEEILRVVFESFGKIKNVDIPMLDPYREVMTGDSFGGFSFGLQTFEAFIQYQESTDFIKAMESLRGMKLMLKGDDGKALACNIKVMFDTTKHFSEGAIRRRNQERLKLQELEEEKKKEKRREEEIAERKRKDEERRAQEKRKKARLRRQVLKERDRSRPRKLKVKAKPEAPQEPDSSEEWEERKYLLAQRRVEALRLLPVLLKNISVRLFPSCSSVLGSTQFNPREVDITDQEMNYIPSTTLSTVEEGKLNTQHLLNQEEMPEYQVTKSDNKGKQTKKKRARAYLHKSSNCPRGKKLSSSSGKGRSKLLTVGYNYSFISDQNSLQITMSQGQSLENKGCHKSTESCSSTLSELNRGRKPKIYETDEFIDYLLNYYQTPEYARVIGADYVITCDWQRDIEAKGNGFQITLRKHECHSEKLERREEAQEDDYWLRVCIEDPEHKPQKSKKVDYTKECVPNATDDPLSTGRECHLSEKSQVHQDEDFQSRRKNQVSSPISSGGFDLQLTDFLDEAGEPLSPIEGERPLLESSYIYQDEDVQSRRKSQVSSPISSQGLDLQLSDFLEEISSDSECFSEILSVNKEESEESEASYPKTAEKGTLDTDEIILGKQKPRLSQQTLYSKWKHENEEKYSKYKLPPQRKREKYELRYSRLTEERTFSMDENSSRKRRPLAIKHCFGEGSYPEYSYGDQLEDIRRKKRRVSHSILDQEGNFRPSHMPIMPFTNSSAYYLEYYPQRRESPMQSAYSQDAKRLKRYDNSKDFMFDCDSYYITPGRQKYTDYRRYLGNNSTSSSYFQMF
ncbi:A-kinase anchor protein 17B-like [Perognathus longimembris pacificus]|uniref:A-kinase anchor protein 17B-like n=1 Tax=Perognathus longimembris pacificus TaxID=214514 RepID=UPI002019C279|nr:A-kinase anchor protein 17B-like [Perognathus longimembris pacificus]